MGSRKWLEGGKGEGGLQLAPWSGVFQQRDVGQGIAMALDE